MFFYVLVDLVLTTKQKHPQAKHLAKQTKCAVNTGSNA